MVTKPKYGQLNLFQDQIETTVIAFFSAKEEEYRCYELRHMNGTRNRIEFTYGGINHKIDFHFNKDGSTTIDLTPGGTNAIKEELANFILNSPICQDKEISGLDKPWFTFENVKYEDFNVVLDLIKAIDGVFEESKKIIPGGEQWILHSTTGERVTISYFFKRQKAMVQGKPLKLFSETYTYLMTLIDVEEIPKIMNQQLNVATGITKESIKEELTLYLPDAADKLNDKIKRLSYQAIMNLKVNDEMFDYSFLAFPALRLLEGHLKYIMKEKQIELEKGKFSMFTCTETGNKRYILHPEFDYKFTSNQKEYVEKAYNFFKNNRHSLFHWGNIDNPLGQDRTRMVERLDEATGYITDVFMIVNNYYK
ncbi:RNase LS family HEPN domain-containing protein [Paenisporosarcina indica]|uniref:RNase LS family HEPN domain-containing protein n=1 Tax=Paenisporosarcina indica TaxID=650093 RepID=UPI00094F63E2|nr:RNase LS family HEPN domain-containing protein [Paenisporosarcina indica]